MSILRKGLILGGMLSACLTSAIAQQTAEDPELADLYQRAVHGCPARWEDLVGYVNHAPNDVSSRVRYNETDHANRIDIWAANIRDRQNYIKFALNYFRTDDGELIENYTQIASVLYGCGITRNDYIAKLMNERYVETASFNLDLVRDSDDDGVMNQFDSCKNTSDAPPADTGTRTRAERFENIDLITINTEGCAVWELDEDEDLVPDYFDHCPSELAATTTSDGCADADSDGISNGKDSYPYQDDTICVAE